MIPKTYRILAPVHPFATDPSATSKALGQPALLRREVTTGHVLYKGRWQMGRLDGSPAKSTVQITCDQSNVEVGRHQIVLKGAVLTPGIDFAIGADDEGLATNLAAAVSRVPDFSASSAGAVVTISSGSFEEVDLRVVETSDASAFVVSNSVVGAPTFAAPLFE